MDNVYGYISDVGGGRMVVTVAADTDYYLPDGTYVVIVPLTKPQPPDMLNLYRGLCDGYEQMFQGALEAMRGVRDKLRDASEDGS